MNPYSSRKFVVVRGKKILPLTPEVFKENYVLFKGTHYDCRKYVRQYENHAETMRLADKMCRLMFYPALENVKQEELEMA